MNSLILVGHLLDILEINLSTTPSIKFLFVYMSHRAYPVTQECAINVKVTPKLCNAIDKTKSIVNEPKYFILNQILRNKLADTSATTLFFNQHYNFYLEYVYFF
jgi:hypothetical protein